MIKSSYTPTMEVPTRDEILLFTQDQERRGRNLAPSKRSCPYFLFSDGTWEIEGSKCSDDSNKRAILCEKTLENKIPASKWLLLFYFFKVQVASKISLCELWISLGLRLCRLLILEWFFIWQICEKRDELVVDFKLITNDWTIQTNKKLNIFSQKIIWIKR